MEKGSQSDPAAIVLAGGDGLRLNSVSRQLFGQDVPKQFLPLFDGETLLEQTWRRISPTIPISRMITVLNRAHERHYLPLLGAVETHSLLIQPANRGTAPAIEVALARLAEAGHDGAVAVFPSDHYISDDSEFMRQVEVAIAAVEQSPMSVILLGVEPDGPETAYGWIEPGQPPEETESAPGAIRPIRRFWEKPEAQLAASLFRAGCLWNSFILVASIWRLRALIAQALPNLHETVARIRAMLGTKEEAQALEAVYAGLGTGDFSMRVLAQHATELSVLPITGVTWSDLGEPRRLVRVASGFSRHPQWLDRLLTSGGSQGENNGTVTESYFPAARRRA